MNKFELYRAENGGIPTFDEVSDMLDKGKELTPVEVMIYECEPADARERYFFRCTLQSLVDNTVECVY